MVPCDDADQLGVDKLGRVDFEQRCLAVEADDDRRQRWAVDARSGAEVEMEPGRPEAIEQSLEREGVPVVERGHDVKLVDLPVDAVGELVKDAALACADEPAASGIALEPVAAFSAQPQPPKSHLLVGKPLDDPVHPLAPAADRAHIVRLGRAELAEDLAAAFDAAHGEIAGADEQDALAGVSEQVGLGVKGASARTAQAAAGSRGSRV